jgi:hypothetical protein
MFLPLFEPLSDDLGVEAAAGADVDGLCRARVEPGW